MNSRPSNRAHRALLILMLLAVAVTPSFAQEQRRDRKEIQARINRGWDKQVERMRRAKIEADCKVEAERAYSAIRFNKRRQFAEECVRNASVPAPELHQAN
jgi:hypothetical protein